MFFNILNSIVCHKNYGKKTLFDKKIWKKEKIGIPLQGVYTLHTKY